MERLIGAAKGYIVSTALGAAFVGHHSSERFDRALTAFLRQEVQAPSTAVTELLDMMVEDAHRFKPMPCSPTSAPCAALACAEHIRQRWDPGLDRGSPGGRDREAFHQRLRHHCAPPQRHQGLSRAVDRGYGGRWRTSAAGGPRQLQDPADRLLGQIDAMVALARQQADGADRADSRAKELNIVANVLRTVAPLPAVGELREAMQTSAIARRRRRCRRPRRTGAPETREGPQASPPRPARRRLRLSRSGNRSRPARSDHAGNERL